MTKVREIYLDLDDVLNVLAPAVINELAGTSNAIDYSWWQRRWGYSIPMAVSEIRNSLGKKPLDGLLWPNIDRDMWATIPKSPFCDWLFDNAVATVGMENVFILTRPMRYGDCYAGKADWVSENIGKEFVDQLILTRHKWKLAYRAPHRLLIDDHPQNIDTFLAHGGRAIICPRPWNDIRTDPVEYIRSRWDSHFKTRLTEYKGNAAVES